MKNKQIFLIYDAECPMCDNYCRMVNIRESVGELILVNGREKVNFLTPILRGGWIIDQERA